MGAVVVSLHQSCMVLVDLSLRRQNYMTAWTNKIFTSLQIIMIKFKFNLNNENEITVGNKIEKRLLWGDNYEWRLVGICIQENMAL